MQISKQKAPATNEVKDKGYPTFGLQHANRSFRNQPAIGCKADELGLS